MDPNVIKHLFDARNNAVSELRALYDGAAGRELSAEETQTEARLSAVIEDHAGRITALLDEARRSAEIDEARAAMPAGALEDRRAEDPSAVERRSINDQLRKLQTGELRSVELKWDSANEVTDARTLSKLSAGAGANTVPTSFLRELFVHVTENNVVMASNARILRTASGEALQVPKTTALSAASIITEAGAIGASDPAFGLVTLNAYKYGFLVQVSSELLQDTAVDLTGFLASQGGLALGNGTGAHFIAGNGTGQPTGVATATSGATAAAPAAVAFDDLINLEHSVPTGSRRNGIFIMKDSTLVLIRKLKDSTGQFLWQPATTAGRPDLILGHPVYTDPSMPAATTGLKSVVFGDMSGYYVRIAGSVRVERSDDYAFANDLATWRFLVRMDGNIVDTVGIRTLTQA